LTLGWAVVIRHSRLTPSRTDDEFRHRASAVRSTTDVELHGGVVIKLTDGFLQLSSADDDSQDIAVEEPMK